MLPGAADSLIVRVDADVVFDKSSASIASFGGAGQVSGAELQMVTTTGVLQFGNLLATDISLHGMDRTSYSESLVLIKSTGSISFDTGAAIIAKALDARAKTDITLSADVTVLAGYAAFLADSDSNAGGSFIVAASKTLTVSSPGVRVSITAADMSLASTCVLALSSSPLYLVSTASLGFHLGGASAGGSFVELDATEAIRITTTGTWTVQSPAITILSIAAADTHSAPIELDARSSGGHIDFAGTSTFYSLNATAAAGISVAADVATTTGQLSLDGNYDMVGDHTTSLFPSVALSAGSNLLLHTRASGYVAVSGSGSWSAAGDILLGSGVRVSGSGSTLAIAADSDGSGSGSLTFASTSNITVASSTYSKISLKYSDVAWSSGFALSASNADVVFDKSSASIASFGGAGQVSGAELQMVTTTGVLQFGTSRYRYFSSRHGSHIVFGIARLDQIYRIYQLRYWSHHHRQGSRRPCQD